MIENHPEGHTLAYIEKWMAGKEIAFAFAKAGYKAVVLADIDDEKAWTAAQQCRKIVKNRSFEAIVVKVNTTAEDSVRNVVATVLNELNRIDYNVNCAGVRYLSYIG